MASWPGSVEAKAMPTSWRCGGAARPTRPVAIAGRARAS
jgi:hypothetical protein